LYCYTVTRGTPKKNRMTGLAVVSLSDFSFPRCVNLGLCKGSHALMMDVDKLR